MKKKVIAFGCALALVLAVVLPSTMTYAQLGGGGSMGGGQTYYDIDDNCDVCAGMNCPG